MIGNLANAALPVKILDRFMHLPPRKLLDHSFQLWVFLAHDLFQLHRHHSSVLKLCLPAISVGEISGVIPR